MKVTLEDVSEKAGSNLAQKDIIDLEGDYPIYGASGYIGNVNFYHQLGDYVAVVKDGAGVGRTMYLPEKSSVIGTLQYIIPKDNIVPKYLYYAVKNMHLEKYYMGAAIPHIYYKDYKRESFELPDKAEQLKIVDILDKTEEIIETSSLLIAELDDLLKSRFVELFGDPVTNPFGYEKVPLSQLADIKIGPFGSLLHKEDYIEGGYPLVNPTHIVDGKVAPDNKLSVSEKKYQELSAYQLKMGDVVMGRRGEMGRCAVVPMDGLLCGTGSLLIRTKGEVTADYIQKIISFPSFKKTIKDMAVGQTMPNLNVPIVSNFQIIKPPIEVQERYYALVTQTDKLKVELQKTMEEMQILFDSLMQKYFG